jgi:Lar family restriction alleviation protein
MKRCPFCGSEDTIYAPPLNPRFIKCINCDAQGPYVYTLNKALQHKTIEKAWNQRDGHEEVKR